MDDHRFAALMQSAITQDTTDRGALMRITAECWPGRDDRTVPVGRNWVKLWGPRPMTAAPHRCVAERCGFCN